jgi:hypothetical protein
VADDRWHPAWDAAFNHFVVRVTNPAGFDSDQHFVRTDPGHFEVFDAQGIVNFVQNRSFHY